MIIFDEPYVSDELAAYAETTQTPVLDNAFARKLAERFHLNLFDDSAFAAGVADGGRLYTVSENSLDWVYRNVKNEKLLESIRLVKDKYALRCLLKSLYPDYFFRSVPASELKNFDISGIALPFILKPAVGFYSMGVYPITTVEDWQRAVQEIGQQIGDWGKHYPGSVLGEADFLLEEFIEGDEYALDTYFNDQGEAVILNIMKHDFASADDVGDRLYYTSKEIIEEKLVPFTSFLNEMNKLVGLRNFPTNVELRVSGSGRIMPIECNPLRFSGWSTTDLADFALGINTCDYYLNDRKPDWKRILDGKDGQLYSFIILDKPALQTPAAHFDYEAVRRDFGKVLHLRRMEDPAFPMFGLLFAQTPADNRNELDRIMRSDLSEYLRAAS